MEVRFTGPPSTTDPACPNRMVHTKDRFRGCEVLLERFPFGRARRPSGPPVGSLFRRCRRTKAFRIRLDFSPSPRTGTESCSRQVSFRSRWMGEDSRGSSFVGFFPGRIPGDLPRHGYRLRVPAYANWAVRLCPWANLSRLLHSRPLGSPRALSLRVAPGQGWNAFSSFGPR